MSTLEVPVIAHELMRAATGHPIAVRTSDGQEVILRLATPDELLQFNREGRAYVEQLLGEPMAEPPMTRAHAVELCAPLDLAPLAPGPGRDSDPSADRS